MIPMGYQIPRVDECLSLFKGNSFFSMIDCTDAFFSVPLEEESRKYTAFLSPHGKSYEFNYLPQGVRTGSQIYQRYINTILGQLRFSVAVVFVDDCVIFSNSFEDHLAAIDKVLTAMEDYGLKCNPKKCRFFVDSFQFLGHIVTADGIQPDPEKIKAVKDMVIHTMKDLKSFLGLGSYYRKFIANFATIASPLTSCLRKGVKLLKVDKVIQWDALQLEAIQKLKTALTTAPVLAHPDWDLPFILASDCCSHGACCNLLQI